MNPVTSPHPAPPLPVARPDPLMVAARELEATFLAEMLASAQLGAAPGAFGGGPGEDQFASFLRLEQARSMVAAGGIGLAESFYDAMKERADEPD